MFRITKHLVGMLIFILSFFILSLTLEAQGDYVALEGADYLPPWSVEVMVNKNETDNYQHLLTGTDGNSGIRIEQWWGTKVGFTHLGVEVITEKESYSRKVFFVK